MLFSDDQVPRVELRVTVAVGAAPAAGVPAAFATLSVYVVVGSCGATLISVPLVRFEYSDPSLPEIVAVPATTAPLKVNTGISDVELPGLITVDAAVRLFAVAVGTTFTVTVAVACGPVVAVTVSVYLNAPAIDES